MLHTLALVCLTLMTGCELCVAAFLEPALRALPEVMQLQAVPRVAKRLGAAMPFWYAGSLILTIADTVVQRRGRGIWVSGPFLAATLQIVILALTLGLLVPINNRLARMRTAYNGWLNEARRWDQLHRLRVVLLLLACLSLGFWSA